MVRPRRRWRGWWGERKRKGEREPERTRAWEKVVEVGEGNKKVNVNISASEWVVNGDCTIFTTSLYVWSNFETKCFKNQINYMKWITKISQKSSTNQINYLPKFQFSFTILAPGVIQMNTLTVLDANYETSRISCWSVVETIQWV